MWSPRSSPSCSCASTPSSSPTSSIFTDGRQKIPGRRFAQIIRLKPQHVAVYKDSHSRVWPEVVKQIQDCNIREYSIHWDEPTGILFSSFKYYGYDYEGDMQRMAENGKVREWWRLTDEYLDSFVEGRSSSSTDDGRVPGWWRPVEEVCYLP